MKESLSHTRLRLYPSAMNICAGAGRGGGHILLGSSTTAHAPGWEEAGGARPQRHSEGCRGRRISDPLPNTTGEAWTTICADAWRTLRSILEKESSLPAGHVSVSICRECSKNQKDQMGGALVFEVRSTAARRKILRVKLRGLTAQVIAGGVKQNLKKIYSLQTLNPKP